MAARYTKGPKGTGVLEVTLSPEEVEPFLGAAAKKLAEGLNVPGFRRGHAPRAAIEERLGPSAVLEEAAPTIVKATLPKYLEENDVEVIGEPKVEIEKLAPGNPFQYRATVMVLPNVSLPEALKLTENPKDPVVEPTAFDNALSDLRRMRATEKPVDRPAATGDKLEVDVDVSVDKVPVEGGRSRNHPVLLGDGNFIPGFEDTLIGAKVGETRTFSLPFPKTYHAKNLQGKRGEFTVKVNSVAAVELPEQNDAFAQSLGNFPTLQALKDALAKNLKEEALTRAQQRHEIALIDEVLKQAKFDLIPDALVDHELDKMLAELRADVEGKGGKFDDYLSAMKRTEESFKSELRPQAERRAKTALVLRAIAARERLDVSNERVEQEMQSFATRMGPSPELAEQIRSGDFRRFIKNTLLTQVVLDYLKKQQGDHANVRR